MKGVVFLGGKRGGRWSGGVGEQRGSPEITREAKFVVPRSTAAGKVGKFWLILRF